jgi:2-dehydro-3-deoxyphosphogluconate aldolase/(4S)-4-hydroxy-2-oxoglutarate aldolase
MVIILRMEQSDQVLPVIDALHQGEINIVEITANTPGCFELLPEAISNFPNMLIGAGTITNGELATKACQAGAQFLVTPNLDKTVIEIAKSFNIPIAAGAFSPTEIHSAVQLGADIVKLFPADQLSPEYMKGVMATLPDIPIMPTGGINTSNLRKWINHGASAFGIGGSIVNKGFIRDKRYDLITENARNFNAALHDARINKIN